MPDSTGELIPVDLETFTRGQLNRSEPRTEDVLNRALAAARRYCGWHVTPVRTAETVTLDGPGSRLLILPTLRLTAVTEVTENGVPVDVTSVAWSTRGLLQKKNGGYWTNQFGGIEVNFDHGFDPVDAADWQGAVMSLAERTARDFSGSGREVIGPFQYGAAAAAGSLFTDAERSVFDLYALERMP